MSCHHLAIVGDHLVTEAVLADQLGQEVVRRKTKNSNHQSSVALFESLLEPMAEVIGQDTLYAAVGLSGLESEAHRGSAISLLERVLPEQTQGVLIDEMEAELAGALRATPGVLFRSSLRAEVAVVDHQGAFWKRASETDVLGAEGSSLWLGTRLLQILARMLTGKMAESPRLMNGTLGLLGLDREGLNARLQAPWEEAEVAKLAGLAVSLAQYPEPELACRALVLQASRRLSGLVQGHSELPNLASYSGATLVGAFLEALQQEHPEMLWCAPESDALAGGLLFAKAVQPMFSGDERWIPESQRLWEELFSR